MKILDFFRRKQEQPQPTTCQACGARGAEFICHCCSTERPAYTALKNMTARVRGLQPVKQTLPPCRYEPSALCDCGQRGTCLPAA